MRAPVYRHLEARQSLAGVSLQGFLALLAVALGAIQLLPFLPSVLAVAAAYLVLRLAGHGRPPQYWQHFVIWTARQWTTGGRLSAAARASTPPFPFGHPGKGARRG
jgi:hypothetical protein